EVVDAVEALAPVQGDVRLIDFAGDIGDEEGRQDDGDFHPTRFGRGPHRHFPARGRCLRLAGLTHQDVSPTLIVAPDRADSRAASENRVTRWAYAAESESGRPCASSSTQNISQCGVSWGKGSGL